jgi:hypothetical protein
MLAPQSEEQARAWQHDRRIVYDYLHSGERNLALHAMLRKAIDLAATNGSLAPDFLDYTDDQALERLGALPELGAATLIAGVAGDMEYRRIWAAKLAAEQRALMALLSSRAERLALEARLASEAGFAAHEVIVEPVSSSAERALPPIIGTSKQSTAMTQPAPPAMRLHVFAAPGAPDDYLRRLHSAASRAFSHFDLRADVEMSQ